MLFFLFALFFFSSVHKWQIKQREEEEKEEYLHG